MDRDRSKDWQELCKAAANEQDPEKLMDLIFQLNQALEERQKNERKRRTDDGNATDKNCRASSLRTVYSAT